VDWRRAKEIFGEVLENADGCVTDPRACDAFVARRCGGDEALAAAVRRLVRAHEREDASAADEPTRGPASAASAASAAPGGRMPVIDVPAPATPAVIGPYEVGPVIGEGGFGVVVRAEQREPIARAVAIKIFKPGRDGAAILRRFGVERDALARMDHPGIAAVHDAGQLADGRPYGVMELVPGVPITEAVAAARSGVADRVRLMVRVCRAIHHAHQRAVIHRDIKPSNILVAEQDGELRPRVIDFGIARAVGPQDRPGDTRAGDLLGTPRYMSPEQLSGGGGGDIRTDVHALGVVLCEVLTGWVPRDPRTLALTPDREVPAEPPSRLARRTADRPRRGAADVPPAGEPAAAELSRRLRGDLDRIVLKAVAWDPEDRYDSAAALADDLERFLAGEPVVAVGPSTAYRIRRFVGRHALACGLGAAALLAIIGGGTAAMVGRAEAISARDLAAAEAARATFISRFLLEDMLAAADPDADAGRDVTVVDLLDQAAESAAERFASAPELLADVSHRIGAAYVRVGRPVAAVPVLEAALAAERRIRPPDPERRLRIEYDLADALSFHRDRHAEGVDRMRALEREARTRLGPDHELSMLAWIGVDIAGDHDPEESVARLQAMRETLQAAGEADGVVALRATERLTIALSALGRTDEEIAVLTELVELTERSLGPAHSRCFTPLHRLGLALIGRGETTRGESLVDEAHARASRTWTITSPSLIGMRAELVSLKLRLGHAEEAVEIARLAADGARQLDGAGSIRDGVARSALARALVAAGRADEAIPMLEEILPIRQRQWGPDHPQVGSTLATLALAYRDVGRWAEALEAADGAIARSRPTSRTHLDGHVVRARALVALGRADEARAGLDAAVAAARAAERTAMVAGLEAARAELAPDA
jgi:serine/threonine protein kinase